jgi:hypothetical protein
VRSYEHKTKLTLIVLALLVTISLSEASGQTTASKQNGDNDGITSPSDIPKQRQNQILLCRQLVKTNPAGARDMVGNCRKLLAKFDADWDRFEKGSQQDKEKQIWATFEKQGGFCYGGKIYTKADAQKIGAACAGVKPSVLAQQPKSQRDLCSLATARSKYPVKSK